MAGSMSPLRVPIMTPASGVKPMDVLTDLPPSTAVMLAPLPRWQVMIFISLMSRSISCAQRMDTYLWLVPWKP